MASSVKSPQEPRSVPWFGTRWVNRGVGYWVRRVLISLFFLAVVALTGGMTYGFTLGLTDGQSVAGKVFIAVYVCLIVGAAAYMTRSLIRQDKKGFNKLSYRAGSRARGAGSFLGVSGASGACLGQAAALLAVPLAVGFFLPIFIRSLGRYWIGERQARRELGLDQ